jgi:hypothetical protein
MNQERRTLTQCWESFTKAHPLIFFFLVLALALLTGPLMIAANHATAVLYKDF